MKGCDRCGHLKREHNIVSGMEVGVRLCSALVGNRLCWCPKYLKPGTPR
jgi:hypothetical protein